METNKNRNGSRTLWVFNAHYQERGPREEPARIQADPVTGSFEVPTVAVVLGRNEVPAKHSFRYKFRFPGDTSTHSHLGAAAEVEMVTKTPTPSNSTTHCEMPDLRHAKRDARATPLGLANHRRRHRPRHINGFEARSISEERSLVHERTLSVTRARRQQLNPDKLGDRSGRARIRLTTWSRPSSAKIRLCGGVSAGVLLSRIRVNAVRSLMSTQKSGCRRWGLSAFVLLGLLAAAAAGSGQTSPTRIYIAPDDHTDYMWSADEETYHRAFVGMIDYYLDLADLTQHNPPEYQSRWNCDGTYWLWE